MSTDTDLQPAVAAEFVALVDLLEAGPVERWDAHSRGEGWRVREVVAHLTMPACYSDEELTAELREHDFDFTRLSNGVADRDARRPLGDMTAGGAHAHFGVDIGGRGLRARRLDWSYGSGTGLSGGAEDLSLAVCGRDVPGGRLEGQPLARLR
jgi:Mycothiol maleylpyruvate isomerase N-terminal domain